METQLIDTQNSLGSTLKKAREKKKLKIEDLAKELHILTRHLKALEENDFKSLPPATFARGFAINYGRALGLDTTKVAQLFDQNYPDDMRVKKLDDIHAPMRPMGTVNRDGRPRIRINLFLLLAIIGVIILAVALLRMVSNASKQNPEPKPLNQLAQNDSLSAYEQAQGAAINGVVIDTNLNGKGSAIGASGSAINLDNNNSNNSTNQSNSVNQASPSTATPATAPKPVTPSPAPVQNPTPTPSPAPTATPTPVAPYIPIGSGSTVGSDSTSKTMPTAPASDPASINTSGKANNTAPSEPSVPAISQTLQINQSAKINQNAIHKPNPDGTSNLVLQINQATKVSISDGMGLPLMFGNQPIGKYELTGKPPFSVKIDNIKNVQLSLNQKGVSLDQYAQGNQASFTLNP